MPRVYCAGPLFNDPERQEMAAIARVMEAAGHSTFLPQRDGFECTHLGVELKKDATPPGNASPVMDRAIFYSDVFELMRADVIVANINGRVPDEGTVVEATLAWACGKALVLYKSDWRAPFNGTDNCMLTGLTEFRVDSDLQSLPAAVERELRRDKEGRIRQAIDLGKEALRLGTDAKSALALKELFRIPASAP